MTYVNQDDITTLDEKKLLPTIKMGISTVLGTRKEQQDTVFGFSREPFHIAVVCDGMGGLNAGETASQKAVEVLAKDFLKFEEDEEEIPEFLRMEAKKLDEEVYDLCDEEGERLEAGTTVAAVMIAGKKLYWMSVGDSKIFFIAGNRIFPVTREHNYRLSLDIMKKRGTISEEDYELESKKGEALISYIGMGNLRLIDCSQEAIVLEKGDRVLLCSDGLYRSLTEEEILNIVKKERNVQEAANALTRQVMGRAAVKSQDNTSVVLIQYA